jgi:hypothetical protein
MRDKHYDIQHDTAHGFFQFEKGRRTISTYLATVTASALTRSDLMEWKYSTGNKNVYQLSEQGRTISLD